LDQLIPLLEQSPVNCPPKSESQAGIQILITAQKPDPTDFTENQKTGSVFYTKFNFQNLEKTQKPSDISSLSSTISGLLTGF
jgi:hypothetical protein